MLGSAGSANDGQYDVFISHATEDKDFVAPLAQALKTHGLRVWYDDFELTVGDSLNEKINEGLARSRYGLVILSPTFFKKHWTQHEINGFVARQNRGERIVLPIWHRTTKDEILEEAPPLADLLALNSSTQSMDQIVEAIVEKVEGSKPSRVTSSKTGADIAHHGPRFGVFYVAPAQTKPLALEQIPQRSSLEFINAPDGWISVTAEHEELEYHLDGKKIRVRLDWQNQWQGDEFQAWQLMSQGQPFALTIRPSNGDQVYFPSAVNILPSQSWMGRSNRSGWMMFEIQ